MKTAKVILRKALTYTVNKVKFKKDEIKIVKGEIVDQLLNNSYFSVTLLKNTDVSSKKLDGSVLKSKKKLRRSK